MNHSEQRKKLRAVLTGAKCLVPASVFDPLSARVAETVGYEIGLLGGSVASHTILAAPDLNVLTLTELADQTRRIMRASKLSLIVDADAGYGNALNTMRTLQELEHAGASALSIDDMVLPMSYGHEGRKTVISIEEGAGRLRAAVAARSDSSFIIVARTSSLGLEGLESTVARAKAYAKAGADAFFVALEKSEQPDGIRLAIEQLDTIRAVANMPLIVGTAPPSLKPEDLAVHGARILYRPHQPIAAAVKALQETYTHLYNGGAPGDLKPRIASPEEMERLVNADAYKKCRNDYLS